VFQDGSVCSPHAKRYPVRGVSPRRGGPVAWGGRQREPAGTPRVYQPPRPRWLTDRTFARPGLQRTQTGWFLVRFRALFHSPFGVLFNFPSRYLFAIGLSPVFSLGTGIRPSSGCTPKQPDSTGQSSLLWHRQRTRGSHPQWRGVPADFPLRPPDPRAAPKGHNSAPSRAQIPSLGFLPLRSPLLGESSLVSFPPLSNMLKFSG
jgi:hypothetical protein